MKHTGAMARPFIAFAALLALAGVAALPARAQDDLAARMARDAIGDIQPGEYAAGDSVRFALMPANGNYLLRFDDNPEVFVLYTDRASLGGRILKYDSGTTALQVSSWGGVTLYTDAKPNGLPAVRDSDAPRIALTPVSLSQLQAAAADEAGHLAFTRRLTLNFTADWSEVSASPVLRALCYDTLENAAHGIERFAASAAGHAAIAARISVVQIATGNKPTIALRAKTLIVTYNPDHGFTGRASSRAIAHALGTVLGIKGG